MGYDGEDMSVDEGEYLHESTDQKPATNPKSNFTEPGGSVSAPAGGGTFSSFTDFVFGTSTGEGDEEEEKAHERSDTHNQPPPTRRESEPQFQSRRGDSTANSKNSNSLFLNSVFGTSTGEDDEEVKESSAPEHKAQAQHQNLKPFPFNEPNVLFNIGAAKGSTTASKKKFLLKTSVNKATPKKKDSHSSPENSRENSAEKPLQTSESFFQRDKSFGADTAASSNSFFPSGSEPFDTSSSSSSATTNPTIASQSFSVAGDSPPSWWFNPGGKSISNAGSTKKSASGKQRGRVNKLKRSGINSSISSHIVNTPSSPSPSTSDGDVTHDVSQDEGDTEKDEDITQSTANIHENISQKPQVFFGTFPKQNNDFYKGSNSAFSSLDENFNPLPQTPNAVPEIPVPNNTKTSVNTGNSSKTSTSVPINSSFSTSADDPPRQHHGICDMAERYSQQGKGCYSAGIFAHILQLYTYIHTYIHIYMHYLIPH